MPAIIPAEFWLEFQWNTSGMPAIIRRSSCWKCLEFQGNTGGMPAIIPVDSGGFRWIPAEFRWNPNLHGIPGKSGLEFRRDSTGIPGLFLLGWDRQWQSYSAVEYRKLISDSLFHKKKSQDTVNSVNLTGRKPLLIR